MKKGFLALACAVGFVFSSQAVLIHWDTEEVESDAASAMLVYYTTDPGESGLFDANRQITGTSYQQSSFNATTAYEEGYNTDVGSSAPNTGVWYLVLLDSTGDNYKAVSMNASAVTYYTGDISQPQVLVDGGMGTVTMPTAWTPTPEPCSVALLLLGAAAMATRRKKLIA